MSVCSATSLPSRVAFHGVFGSGLSTTVLPAASAGPSLLRMTSIGKLDGVIGGDDADGLLDDRSHVAVAEQAAALERALPFEVVDQPPG